MGDSFTKEAYEKIYKHPKWKTVAQDYEEQLAVKLFHNSYTKDAVKTALSKISRILTAYYGTEGRPLTEQERQTVQAAGAITDLGEENLGMQGGDIPVNKTLVRALMQGRRDNTGAGQVKKLVEGDAKADGSTYTAEEAEQENMQTLDAVMNRDGNLREQMTLLYNGMFINGGSKKEDIQSGVSFKGVLQGVKRPGAEAAVSPLSEINYDLLEGMTQYQEGKDVFDTYHLARDMEKRSEEMQGKGNLLTRWWRGFKRAWSAAFSNNFKRSKRKNGDGLGMGHYRRLGIEPSARESAYSLQTDEDGNQTLLWKEGTAYYKPNDEVTAEGMLQTAGTSGTTLRMLGAYRLMGASAKDLLDFRLALIAWMISSHDHSLFEILQGSHNAGVKGTEDISEAATMYMNIDPLDADLLREGFAVNGEFPHEIIYKEQLNELYQARIDREKKAGTFDALNEKRTRFEAQLDGVMGTMADEIDAIEAEMFKRMDDLSYYQGLLMGANPMAFADDFDGTQRQECAYLVQQLHEEIEEYQARITKLDNDLAMSKQKMQEDIMQNPDIKMLHPTLYMRNDFMSGTDAHLMKAYDLALNIYSTSAYMAMNNGQKWGNTIGKMQLKSKKGGYQGAYAEEYKDGKLLEQIFDMVRISTRMVQDALEERGTRDVSEDNPNLPDSEHASYMTTFRGEKGNGSKYMTQGYEYENNYLTSSSKDWTQALSYYAKQIKALGPKNAVLISYKLEGKGAVDIENASAYQYEREVLIPKGTKFRVTKPLVRNVKISDLMEDAVNYQSDTVTEEELNAEVAAYVNNPSDVVNAIKHVNVVQVIEIDGPGARRRQAKRASEEARRSIRASLMQG